MPWITCDMLITQNCNYWLVSPSTGGKTGVSRDKLSTFPIKASSVNHAGHGHPRWVGAGESISLHASCGGTWPHICIKMSLWMFHKAYCCHYCLVICVQTTDSREPNQVFSELYYSPRRVWVSSSDDILSTWWDLGSPRRQTSVHICDRVSRLG